MLPLAHIGITIFLVSIVFLPITAALVGALAPDVVDKLLLVSGLAPCGRFFSHSIFFGPILAVVAYLLTRRKDVALAVLLGCYLHLLMDTRYFLPWFYPLVQYDFYCPAGIVIRPDLIDMCFESIGAVLIPVTLALKPKIKYFKRSNFKRLSSGNPSRSGKNEKN